MNINLKAWYSVADVARILGMSYNGTRRRIEVNGIKMIKKPGLPIMISGYSLKKIATEKGEGNG